MKEKVHRGIWGFMAFLFIVTALGFGVYVFINGTHPANPQSDFIQCAKGGKAPNQQPVNGKVKGAKLAGYTPPQSFSYLKCTDFVVGTAAQVQSVSANVTVDYVGALASDGTIFDDSFDSGQPLSIALNQVIPGWSNGLLGMRAGGIRRLYIPAQYGYGTQSQPGIPPNSDLVFDVKLLDVK